MRTAAFLLAGFMIAAALGDAAGAGTSTVRLKARSFTPVPGHRALDDALDDGVGSRRFFVQLAALFDPSIPRELEGMGVRLTRYIPDDTWIASLTRDAIADPSVRERLAWAGEIDPGDKVLTRLLEADYRPWAVQPDGRLELRVRLHDDVDSGDFAAAVEALGAQILSHFGLLPGVTLIAPEAMIWTLAEMDDVMWITDALPAKVLENDGSRAVTGAETLQAPPYGLTGQGVRVGIWDGGWVDADHEDFQGRLTLGDNSSTASHATHVAGTFGGSGLRSEIQGGDPLQWRGMAPEVGIYSYDYNGNIIGEIEDGILTYDLDLETNSWGFGVGAGNCEDFGDYDGLAPEFDALVRGAAGRKLNISFSAGNERNDGDCPLVEGEYGCINPPKPAKNIITVGATNSDDDSMTWFSSWGPVDDGRLKPDVTAPGCEAGGEGYVRSTLPGGGYGGPGWCGTSMAAPANTGALALLYEAFAAENQGADPEPSLMKGLLVATAADLGNPGPDYAFGHGRIDGKAAVDALLVDTQLVFDVAHGEIHDVTFHVPEGTESLRAALVWDDPDAAPLADPALVNDLDLVLIDPDLVEHHPWVLDPDAPSADAVRAVDGLNNVEHVTVGGASAALVAGTWTARVTGTNVPQGPQTASLVGLDRNAPGIPAGFDASNPTPLSIELTWTNAEDVDREGTLVVRMTGAATWLGPAPGETFVEGQEILPDVFAVYARDEDHSSEPFTDGGVDPGITYRYRAYTFDDMHNYSRPVFDVETTPGVSGADEGAVAAFSFSLGLSRPNPAGARAEFSYAVAVEAPVVLRVFDPSGRAVRTLVHETVPPGAYTASWDGTDDGGRAVSAGVYFYQLRSGGRTVTRHLSWVR